MDYDVPRQLSMSATDCHNHAMAAASAARAAMWSPSFWSIAEIKAESERMASAWRHVAGSYGLARADDADRRASEASDLA